MKYKTRREEATKTLTHCKEKFSIYGLDVIVKSQQFGNKRFYLYPANTNHRKTNLDWIDKHFDWKLSATQMMEIDAEAYSYLLKSLDKSEKYKLQHSTNLSTKEAVRVML